MYYIYVLHSLKDKHFYTGFTENLDRRITEHLSGYVKSTKSRLPMRLVYYEAYINEKDAKGREVFLKSGSGKRYLNKQLKHYLQMSNEE
jgi:putative endonuclease